MVRESFPKLEKAWTPHVTILASVERDGLFENVENDNADCA